MGPRTNRAKIPSIAHAKSPSQPRRARHANNPPSITPRQLRPVITASLLADLWIEKNDDYWGGAKSGGCWYGYSTKTRQWYHANDIYCSHWECCEWTDPDYVDASLDVVAELRKIIKPFTDTASVAEQKRLGGWAIISDAMRFLQHDERCAMRACDAEHMLLPPPKQAERRAEMRSRAF